MPKYSVCLEGKGFPIMWEGVTQQFGFYTTRKVRAPDPESAELAAVELVKSDPELHALIDTSVTSDPQVFLESVAELRWWSRLGGKGYTFYPMEEE